MSTTSARKPRSRKRSRSTTEFPPSPSLPMPAGSTSPIRTTASVTRHPPVQLQERRVIGDDLDVARWAGRNGGDRVVDERVPDAGVSQPDGKVGTPLASGHDLGALEVFEADV